MRKASGLSPLNRIFGIDLRSLALFRVALGLVFLYDLFIRASDLSVYYTDTGVVPRAVQLISRDTQSWFINIHMLSGIAAMQAVLFAIAGLSALCMIIGYRTRAATFITWLLLISVQNRNTFILHGGDTILRLLFFWSLFIPLGARYSIDAIQRRLGTALEAKTNIPGRSVLHARDRNGAEAKPAGEADAGAPRVFSVGSAAILLQMCLLYWFSALLKSDEMWHNGTAIYYSLSFEQLARPFGVSLLQYPNVCRQLTFVTYALERLGPVFALFPYWHGRIRTAFVLVFIAFHISLGVCFSLGNFPMACSAGWLLFIPSETWDWLGRRFAAKARPRAEQRTQKVRHLAVVLAEALPRTPVAQGTLVPRLRAFGRTGSQVLAGCFLLYVTMWNVRTVDFDRWVRVFPRSVNWIAHLTRVDQMWDMFAPPPSTNDGWFVVPAQLANGLEVDLYNHGEPVTWAKPRWVAYTAKNERQQKFMINLTGSGSLLVRRSLADYLCREWNSRHVATMQVTQIKIYYMNEVTLPDNQIAKPRKKLLGTYTY